MSSLKKDDIIETMMKVIYKLLFFLIFCTTLLTVYSAKAFTDSDLDGLSDDTERARGLDPYQYDTDKGGVGDGAELLFDQTDPLNPADDIKKDKDRDGLSNTDELVLGTSVMNKDTDNDGLSDYEERQFGSYGYVKDSDNDGLSDSKERLYHTNPLLWDTDGDGVADGAELLIDGTDALDKESFVSRDSDEDGLTDAEEVIFGTDKDKADTDGDGYEDALEIAQGYNPNGGGQLDYQRLLSGKRDARSEGLIRESISIQKITLLQPYSAKEKEPILLLEGEAPPLIEAELLLYLDEENEALREGVDVDLKGKWIKKIDLSTLSPGDYLVYLAVSTSQGRILVKSNPKKFSFNSAEAQNQGTTEEKEGGTLQSLESGGAQEGVGHLTEEKKSNLRLIIGLPILLIIMLGGGIVIFVLSRGRREEEIEVPQQSSVSALDSKEVPISSLSEKEPPPSQPEEPSVPATSSSSSPTPQSLQDISGKTVASKGAPPANLPSISSSTLDNQRGRLADLAKRMR